MEGHPAKRCLSMGVSPSNADFMQLIYVKSNMQKWINSRINTTTFPCLITGLRDIKS